MKNTNSFIILTTLWICLGLINGCEPGDGKLIIQNNSDDTIFFIATVEKEFRYSPLQYSQNGKIDWRQTNGLAPKSKMPVGILLSSWESSVRNGEDSSLYVFFFIKDLIYNTPKDSLIKYQKYSSLYKLKLPDLEKRNWKVIYPSLTPP